MHMAIGEATLAPVSGHEDVSDHEAIKLTSSVSLKKLATSQSKDRCESSESSIGSRMTRAAIRSCDCAQ